VEARSGASLASAYRAEIGAVSARRQTPAVIRLAEASPAPGREIPIVEHGQTRNAGGAARQVNAIEGEHCT
jgi:hypothetical protein